MKKYGALRGIGQIIQLVGWLIIILSIGFFGLFLFVGAPTTSYSVGGYVSVVGFVISLAGVLSGLMVLASGQMIEAFVDIAMHAQRLPLIAEDTRKTVSFFEHMSERANRPAVQ